MTSKKYSIEIGGKALIAEFSDLAEQANGSVIVRYGDTVILATAVMGELLKEDFFPLTVDYEERFYAVGRILGGRFAKREGRPSIEATLTARIVDRTIRPLFDKRMRNEVQVVLTTLSVGEDDPDTVSVIAASLAIGTSDIPWNGPVSAVRVAKSDTWLMNPDFKLRAGAAISLELLACGKGGMINMIEAGGKEASESLLNEALTMASEAISKIEVWQRTIVAEIGKKKRAVKMPARATGMQELFNKEIQSRLAHGLDEANRIWSELFSQKFPGENVRTAQEIFNEAADIFLHSEAIEHDRRADGRGLDEIRPLYAKAGGISPVLHGSGIFYRGGTHIMTALTLGGPGDALSHDDIIDHSDKRFMHHYNFPPYSTGETGRIGGANRRMIGHGALAEKAFAPMIPPASIFPYTIRLVSEALASNGSTSMASVCGSTIALMDGGVPIKAPVAGISCGLMMRTKPGGLLGKASYEYKILTDIQGPEDHHGDMDFKVAGTRTGITAVQMDVKVEGIPLKILAEAFEKARKARLKVLDVIEKEIAKPRATISSNAPEIVIMTIAQDQIGHIIGPGGKTINEIKDKTGIDDITIKNDGSVFITGKGGTARKAKDMVEGIIKTSK